MKLLHLLLLSSFFVINYSFIGVDSKVEQYCNARFEYCVSYPTENFAAPQPSENGDGFQATTKDGELFMSVAGSFNVMDWTLEDIYYFNNEDFKQQEESPVNVESVFETNYSINVFETETQYIYFKTMLLDDKYVTITISAPLAMRERVEALRNEIKLTTNA